jgi:polyisoprenoid-binding protein YceI
MAAGVMLASSHVLAAEKKAQGSRMIKIDPKASVLRWEGKKVTGVHDGTVGLKSGHVRLINGAPHEGEFVIDMTTIENNDIANPESRAKLVGHLKSADFFEVDKYPTAKLVITEFKPIADGEKAGETTHHLSGNLTIKDITHPVMFPATIKIEGDKAEARGNLMLDRTKWNVRYGSGKFYENLGDKMIHDNFTVDMNLVGKVVPAPKK